MKCDYCERTDADCRIKKIKGVCYCPRHISQHYRHGEINDNTIYKQNDYIIHDDYAEIVLRDKTQNVVGLTKIDIDDVERCKEYKWHARTSYGNMYAVASLKDNVKLHLHRFVIGYDGGLDVDHINLDPLDNRKSNLRVVTHAVNARNNASIGVKPTKSGKWRAYCYRNYHNYHIGVFDTYDEAVFARMEFIKKMDKD